MKCRYCSNEALDDEEVCPECQMDIAERMEDR